ncbi:MAG: metal-sensing transcriptional repressor [Provencibacterium sp.]|jgi:DNA-binding FrmR family transcriptional regulator|nr:metal-sensing transcriptional repressor [Provencibacterium sp.]
MKADSVYIARLLKTARGQIDGILRMVEEDRYCVDVANQLTAAEAVLRRCKREILRAHLEGCVRNTLTEGNIEETDDKIAELIDVFERLMD